MSKELEEARDIIKQKICDVEEFFKRLKRANEIAPVVQKYLERLKWILNTIETMPEEGRNGITNEYLTNQKETGIYFRSNYLDSIDNFLESPATLSSLSSVDSSITLDLARMRRHREYEPYRAWATVVSGEFYQIQKEQEVFDNVQGILAGYCPPRASQLQECHDNFYRSKSIANGIKEVALNLRRLIEEFKGDLLKFTGIQAKKGKQWGVIAENLALGGIDGAEYNIIINQKVIYDNLHKELTLVGKQMKEISFDELEQLYARAIEHIYTVINVIDIKKVS